MELVNRLIAATAQVVEEVGLERTSTNKIAARAGVAIGSIYQYFSNKEALIDALIEDRLQRMEALSADRLEALSANSFPEAAEEMLRATVAFHEAEPALAGLLASRIAMPQPTARDRELYQRVLAMASSYLITRTENVEDVEIAAAISGRVIGSLAPWIALSVTDHDERERYIAEIVRMLARWIGGQTRHR